MLGLSRELTGLNPSTAFAFDPKSSFFQLQLPHLLRSFCVALDKLHQYGRSRRNPRQPPTTAVKYFVRRNSEDCS